MDFVVKGISLVLLLLFFIPLLPFLGLLRLIGHLREKAITAFKMNEILPAVRSMKNIEEMSKFREMKRVLDLSLDELDVAVNDRSLKRMTDVLLSDINIDAAMAVDVTARECTRLIVRELVKQEGFLPAWIPVLVDWKVDTRSINDDGSNDWLKICDVHAENKELKQAIQTLLYTSEGIASSFALDLSAKMFQRHSQLLKLVQDAAGQLEKFRFLFGEMLAILQDSADLQNNAPTQANRKFISAFRKVLRHPIYKLLKLSHSHRSVLFLHDISAAIWNSIRAFDLFGVIGKAIIADGLLNFKQDEKFQERQVAENIALAGKLRQSQKIVASNHYHNDGISGKFVYAIMHFWHSMGSLASEGGVVRFIPFLLGVDQYDSHGTLSNNPTHQACTVWKGDMLGGQVNNCYGGSPTIGDHLIAPEFKALLQAAENNMMQTESNQRKGIPLRVVYTSLQNLDKRHGERPRSKTIMYLNEAFPLSFTGIVLAKDSSIYLIKKPEDLIWENAPQFGEAFKERLMLGVQARFQSGHGFYFPGSVNQWEKMFDAAIAEVNREFQSMPVSSDEEKKQLQGAYQEYIYSLIGAAIECRVLANLTSAGNVSPLIMTISACKENIDRGGMENMKYLYLRIRKSVKSDRLLTKDEMLESLVGFMHARSLSSRDRAILEDRIPQVLGFMELVSAEKFDRTLTRFLSALGLNSHYTFKL